MGRKRLETDAQTQDNVRADHDEDDMDSGMITLYSDIIEDFENYKQRLKRDGKKRIATAVEEGVEELKEDVEELRTLAEQRLRNTPSNVDTTDYW